MGKVDTYYEYEDDGIYCYPGSFVLKNKLGIEDYEELKAAEREITALKLAQMDAEPSLVKQSFDAKHLCSIHKLAFGDIYEWAGEYRSINISKGTLFCAFQYISDMVDDLMGKLAAEKFLADAGGDLGNRLAFYLGEINAIHPFREGNGRTQRAFVRQLAWRNGHLLSFADVADEEMAVASLESFNGNNSKMEEIVARGLSRLP